MSKLIIKNRYGIIPNDILNDKELSFRAKGLYSYLQSKPDNWKFSVIRIALQTKEGETAIMNAIKELEQAKLLERIPIKDTLGKWKGYDYLLSEKPSLEKPKMDKPKMDKPLMENLVTLSKKDYSKKDYSKKDIVNKNNKLYLSEDLRLAKLLFSLIKQNSPTHKQPNMDSWANDVRKIRELDGRTEEQIEIIMRWAQQNDFWQSNILSPAKLRKQFDALVIKARSEIKFKQEKKGIKIL